MTRTKPYFGRLMTAMVTFFHEDGSLNADGTADFAAWLVEHGSDAILGPAAKPLP